MADSGLGQKAAVDLGKGWKISPAVKVQPRETFTVADIQGMGAIQQIWMTPSAPWRYLILRIYWDGEKSPSVEAPVGDFFACGWGEYAQVSSLPVCVNPGSAFNCYWEMPIRKSFRITVENIGENDAVLFYQVNYTLTDVPTDAAYFHAQFRRVNPLPYKDVYTILDGVRGWGHYVGTYMAWGVNNNGWWGEGEIKFFSTATASSPPSAARAPRTTSAGPTTSTWARRTAATASSPRPMRDCLRIRPDGLYQSQQRFGLYRWHIMDPVRFEQDIHWPALGPYSLSCPGSRTSPVLEHPLILHKLARLRDKRTPTKEFRTLVSEIAMLMTYETTRDLPTWPVTVDRRSNRRRPGWWPGRSSPWSRFFAPGSAWWRVFPS